MSLTSFVGLREVRERITPLRPKMARTIKVTVKVKSRSKSPSLIGTAFDYLLRFELQRRAPHAIAGRWVAEAVPKLFYRGVSKGGERWMTSSLTEARLGTLGVVFGRTKVESQVIAKMAGECAAQIVQQARSAVTAFVANETPSAESIAEVAGHAVRLAQLEPVRRALHVHATMFDEPRREDVREILDLLGVVPFGELLHDSLVMVNGESSKIVDGADADLISGNRLVEFKTKQEAKVEPGDLDQLLGYFLLARKERQLDATFPEINDVAIYFSRHGHLWSMKTSQWTEQPQFPSVEKWFSSMRRKCAEWDGPAVVPQPEQWAATR